MTARRFASETSVSPERSRAEIETLLNRYGATRFGYATEPGRAVVQFSASARMIRLTVSVPSPTDEAFATTGRGARHSESARKAACDQEIRRRWRSLALVVKAKLEAVESGIATFEQEFLAYVVLPDGSTVGQRTAPELAKIYESGKMPGGMLLLGDGMDRGKP